MIRSCAAESLPQNGCEDGDTMALVTECGMALSKKRETPETARISLENEHPMGFLYGFLGYKSLFYMCLGLWQMEPHIILCGRSAPWHHAVHPGASTSIFADEFLEDLLRTRSGLGENKSNYPLVNIQKAIENGHLSWVFPLNIVIFHSYVSFPEGSNSH